jgi:NADH dehydrogenase
MSKLVTIYGGSGFVGRYIARRMAKEGWRVRVAVRRPNQALFVKPYGAVGQVEPVLCNLSDEASVAAAMRGADAVVNCVGILNEVRKNKFDAIQTEGAGRVARLAAASGVKTLVHLSALGGDESNYGRSKASGEAAVLAAFPTAMILRPSILFGAEDHFFNFFALMARFGPILPVVGGDTKFQPVYVDDVAAAAVLGITGNAIGTYDLGGPDVETFKELMQRMLNVTYRRRLILNVPFFIARIMGGALDLVQAVTGGLIVNKLLTRDQAKNLERDSIVGEDAQGFDALGISPTPMSAILAGYLWRFRPHGQFDDIQASAKNLRKSS